MAIMVILMAVAIVSLRGSQANARDSKRASDTETIARGLEERFTNGLAQPTNGASVSLAGSTYLGGTSYPTCGNSYPNSTLNPNSSYPTTEELTYVGGTSDSAFCPSQVTNFLAEDLPGTSASNYATPNGGSLVMATSTTTPSAATVGSNYYYLPLTSSGSLCNSVNSANMCVSYTLYYVSEVSGTVQTVRSRHQ